MSDPAPPVNITNTSQWTKILTLVGGALTAFALAHPELATASWQVVFTPLNIISLFATICIVIGAGHVDPPPGKGY